MNLRLEQRLTHEQLVRQQIEALLELCQIEREAVREVRKAIESLEKVRGRVKRYLRDCAWEKPGFSGRPVPWSIRFCEKKTNDRRKRIPTINSQPSTIQPNSTGGSFTNSTAMAGGCGAEHPAGIFHRPICRSLSGFGHEFLGMES